MHTGNSATSYCSSTCVQVYWEDGHGCQWENATGSAESRALGILGWSNRRSYQQCSCLLMGSEPVGSSNEICTAVS